jgi:SMC interacting uncharacterized protein involved in chromosome segregation
MVGDWAVLLLFLMGWAVGLIQATGKVNFLSGLVKQSGSQKELARKVESYQVLAKKLEMDLVKARSEALVLQSALDSAQVRLSDSELELVRVKQSQSLRETELAMELEKVRAQVWVQRE